MTFYGACGNERCADCRPLFDVDNEQIAGTDSITGPEMYRVVNAHNIRKYKSKSTGLWAVLDINGEFLFSVFADTAAEAIASIPDGYSAQPIPIDG